MVEMKRTFTTFPWVRKMGVGGKNPLLYKENKSLDSSWPCHFLPVISGTCSASTWTLFHQLGKQGYRRALHGWLGRADLSTHRRCLAGGELTSTGKESLMKRRLALSQALWGSLPSVWERACTPLLPLSHPTLFPSRPQKMCSQQDVSTAGCSLEM